MKGPDGAVMSDKAGASKTAAMPAAQAPGSGQDGPRVSVVIPVFNAATTIRRAMDSVAAQGFTDWEALLVDDASTDDSVAIMTERAALDPRFRLIRLPRNQGVSNARNAGIAAARGRYIAFLDADDCWMPEKLDLQIPLLDSGVPLVCSAYRRVDPQGRDLGVVRPPERIVYARALGGNPVGCLTAIWDRERFPDARMPALSLHEDYAFWLSLLRDGAEGRGLPHVLAEYTVRPQSRSSRKRDAARATWRVLRGEPGIGLPRAVMGFVTYGTRSLWRWAQRRQRS